MFITDYLDICDPVIEIDRLLSHININKYLDDIPHHRLGRLRYDVIRQIKIPSGVTKTAFYYLS